MKKLLTYARVSEVGDAGTRIADAYQKNSAAQSEAFLKTLLAEVQSRSAEITQAVKRDTVNSELEEADTVRDNRVRVLGRLLRGYKDIPVAALKPHGERLAAIFEKYGARIADANYTEESNLISAMLMDFSAPDLAPAIAALPGTAEAVADLRSAQESFANIRGSYDSAVAMRRDSSTASTLRKPLLQLINGKLVPYIDALAMGNPAVFSAFSNEVSQIIDTINASIKARMHKPAEKTEENS